MTKKHSTWNLKNSYLTDIEGRVKDKMPPLQIDSNYENI